MARNREYILAGLLVVLTALSALVLREVLQTVVFAITVAYVAFLPDAVLRTNCPRQPAKSLRASTSSVALTVGPISIIAGPFVVALLLEAVDLLAGNTDHQQAGNRC